MCRVAACCDPTQKAWSNPINVQHVNLTTNGITLHCVQSGDPANPPIILLHGFPEFWYGWRHQIPALAAAGFHVTAPDQRGYNLSDKPSRLRDYRIDTLAADVAGLIDTLNADRGYLVGHDWGGVIAWWVAQNYPDRIAKLAILNAPHVPAYQRYLLTHPTQWLKSWYIGFFQTPLLPDAILKRILWTQPPPDAKHAFTAPDLAEYRAAISQPRALWSMLAYYRANARFPRQPRIADPRIHVPTLILWGKRDAYLEAILAQRSAALCDDARVQYFDTSHWLQHEAPDQVNAALIDFFS